MIKSILCLSASALLLSACASGSVKQTLGLDSRAPDEFRVVSRPPLSVPPQFDLRPPGVEGTTNSAMRDRAQEVILGNQTPSGKGSKKTSNADSIFLEKAGAAQADPNVKQQLAEKKIDEQLQKEEASWWDRLTPSADSKKEPIVKAEGEAERIKKNQEEGKPITEGATPESGGGTMSTLERWFGDW